MSRSIKKLKKDFAPSVPRVWYNKWVEKNAKGKVLDVGKSRFWDYGFPTIDINQSLEPTFTGSIERTIFPDDYFDTVLCNGMKECVENTQAMINEVMRITKGTAIFGFVGKDYKPYKKNWSYYDGSEKFFGEISKKDFGSEYHFIICKKV